MDKITIGLIGFGTIGRGVVKILKTKSILLSKRIGAKINLQCVCDKDIRSLGRMPVERNIFTTDIGRVLDDPGIQIVIELIGGTEDAKEILLRALRNKKHVITANKALLAEHGEELFNIARRNNVRIYFEAAVGGGIPIIRSIRNSLVANEIKYIYAIINGTANYILTQMSELNRDFKSALTDAQKKGFAEKDPTLDIDGIDSAHKIAILSKLCFGQFVKMKDIYVEGIQFISLSDILYAEELGYCIKLLSIAKREARELDIRVHPTLLPRKHMLASVNGVFNAVHLGGDLVGDMLFYGKGAGQLPTASAVIGDLNDAVALLNNPAKSIAEQTDTKIKRIRDIKEINSGYYLRVMTVDQPGVLAKISNVLGRHNISIHSVIQKGGKPRAKIVPIVMMTHEAKERNMQKAITVVNKLEVVKKKAVLIRIEKG
ncbi:MAG: homoserine dehydrogenase [Candidatus Omnitrophota bacterium]